MRKGSGKMQKIVQYMAYDGILFDDEDACLEYELKRTRIPKSITLWDDKMTYLDATTEEGVDEAWQKAEYVEIADIQSWREDVDWMASYWGCRFEGVEGPGFYKYNWNIQEWENATKEVQNNVHE
jgi:hypothetical protein